MKINVTCPCCNKVLEVDVLTGEVLSTKDAKPKLSLEDFIDSEKHKTEKLDAMFAEAKEKEKHRMEELDRKFEEAKKRKDLKDPPPTINWD